MLEAQLSGVGYKYALTQMWVAAYLQLASYELLSALVEIVQVFLSFEDLWEQFWIWVEYIFFTLTGQGPYNHD